MTTQFVGTEPRPRGEQDKKTLEIVGAGSLVEAFGAAGAVVLAILGLAGALPFYMVTIGTILLGAALLFEGGAIASRYERVARRLAPAEGTAMPTADLAEGISAESLAGLTGITLGILALLGLVPYILVPVSVIVFGAGLLFASAATARLNALVSDRYAAQDATGRVIREAIHASVGGEVLFGIGAIVLGILALLGFDPLMLSLVGILAVAFAAMLSGSAVGAKMLGIIRHRA